MTEKNGLDCLYESILGVFLQPGETFRALIQSQGLWGGFFIYFVTRAVVSYLKPIEPLWGLTIPGATDLFIYMARFNRLYGIMLLPVLFFLVIAIRHVSAVIMGSRMPLQRFAAVYGYTFLPYVIGGLLALLAGVIPGFLLGLSAFAIFVWVVALQIIAFKTAYDLPWLNAVVGYFIPALVAVALVVLSLIAAVAVAVF